MTPNPKLILAIELARRANDWIESRPAAKATKEIAIDVMVPPTQRRMIKRALLKQAPRFPIPWLYTPFGGQATTPPNR